MDVDRFLERLRSRDDYAGQITHVERSAPRRARHADPDPPLPARLRALLSRDGIERLYTHQAEAIAHARAGRSVVVVTGTASGKSLCYNGPVLEHLLDDPESTALYLFPTKALAQDQLRTLERWRAADADLPLVAGTYDGDTPPATRRRLRNEANVLLTNPDMLHSGILPNHGTWARFLARLRFVVVDEIHAYRGIFGSNVAHVLARLDRLCAHYGAHPVYVCCSATIRNPGELAARLTGRDVTVIDDDGAPRGPRTFVIWNPPLLGEGALERRSANTEAARLLAELVASDHQSIAFVRARVVSEVVARYAQDVLRRLSPRRVRRVHAYRGGYLPEERRALERALFEGELTGVVSTSALELGIDIGAMEAAILVGFPGTIASVWQRAGRAGRGLDPSVVFFVPYDAPIDQYMANHADYFLGRSPEHAVIDPHNAHIVLSHLRAAAFELPVRPSEWEAFGPHCAGVLRLLEEERQVRLQGDAFYWCGSSYPSADVGLRNISDDVYTIIDVGEREESANRVIGTIDESGAFQQLHPQAVYLHHGETYFVRDLDTHKRIAWVEKEDTDYYTQSLTEVKIGIEHGELEKAIAAAQVHWGDLTVTSLTYMFKRIKFGTRDSLGFGAVDLPPQTLETTGMWILPHASAYALVREAGRVPREGLLGIANVIREVIALLAMCDTMDVGASVDASAANAPGVFVHDRFPGGLGFALKAYELVEDVLGGCLDLITRCPCRDGCPSCVGSPLPPHAHLDPDANTRGLIPDKEAARSILHAMLGLEPWAPARRSDAPGGAATTEPEDAIRRRVEQATLPDAVERTLRRRVEGIRSRRRTEGRRGKRLG